MHDIKCPYCGIELDNIDPEDLDYSGEMFNLTCDKCNTPFSCEAEIRFISHPNKVLVRLESGGVVDITVPILNELEKGKLLYKYSIASHTICTFYRVKEDTLCQGVLIEKGDYIFAPYSHRGKRLSIEVGDLAGMEYEDVQKYYVKVEGAKNE